MMLLLSNENCGPDRLARKSGLRMHPGDRTAIAHPGFAPDESPGFSSPFRNFAMKLILLRGLLVADAGVLFLLGGLLVFAPVQVERAFHFQDLPPAVAYLLGMWGCLMATMGFGYLVAATHPLRYRVWINIGIIRGVLECLVSIVYLARDIVTLQQAGLGALVAALMATAYVVLYPRPPRPIASGESPAPLL